MSEKVIMSAEDMRRAWTRIAHEVIERNYGCDFSQLPMNDDHLYRDPAIPGMLIFSRKDQEYWAGGTDVHG